MPRRAGGRGDDAVDPAVPADAAGPGLWTRIASRPMDRPILSYRMIARAAVGVADEEGLGAVTLRRVAAELAVTAMAIYRYVDRKDDLLVLMVDEAFASPPPPPAQPWRATLTWYAWQQRQVVLDHPWLIQMPPRARTGMTPNIAATFDAVLASFRERADLTNDDVIAIVDTVAAYAHGSATPEAAQRSLAVELSLDELSDVRAAISADVHGMLSTGSLPDLAARLGGRAHSNDMDWRFDLGLTCVLDGLERRFGARPARRARRSPGSAQRPGAD